MKTWFGPWAARRRKRPQLPAELLLSQGEILRAKGTEGGVCVECRKGRVWITQAGDPRDHVLRRGEASRTEGRGLVLVEALGPAVVRITAPFRG